MAQIEEFSPAFNLAAEHIRDRYRLLGVPEKFATVEAAAARTPAITATTVARNFNPISPSPDDSATIGAAAASLQCS